MEQKDKELLFKDLSQRLPYKVKCNVYERIGTLVGLNDYGAEIDYGDGEDTTCEIQYCLPYLRPMSSMTKEEKIKLYQIAGFYYLSNNELLKDEWRQFSDALSENKLFLPYPIWEDELNKVYDWLNAHYFDFRGLIEKGLALEAPKDMYNRI